MDDRSVLVMAKAPRAGRVKTRLAPPCTPAMCAEIAAAAIHDTLAAATATGRRVVLALDGPTGDWIPADVDVVAQCEGGFAERLTDAWRHLPEGGVQIGMDTPHVTAAALVAAIDLLDERPAALGPAHDGGWWALALRAPHPECFHGIAMSTAQTGADQWRRLVDLGLDPVALDPLTDIDDWASALAVAAAAPDTFTAATIRHVAQRLQASS